MKREKSLFYDCKEINLNLFYLENSLHDLLNRCDYPKIIRKNLNNLIKDVQNYLYGSISCNFDIVDEKALLITLYDKC